MSELVGAQLDHYQLVSLLGSGGMGEVYEGKDLKLGRTVAVKILPREFFDRARSRRRFEQEARSASALNHPNIVTIHDVGQSQGLPYIVMELVRGKSLRQLIDAKALSMRRVIELGSQIADGLSQAHAHGIVHRDLKPQNLMVSDEGYIKIVDFGLAKLNPIGSISDSGTTEHATEPGAIVGTVQYMSPEQASGQAADFHSDQFSLGVILYEMITGENPFTRKSVVETMAALINDPPEPLARTHPELPLDLEMIVGRCLEKRPEDRFTSTDELRHELREARDRLTASAVTRTPWTRLTTFWRRRFAAVLATLVAVGGLTVLAYRDVLTEALPAADVRLVEDDWILVASFDNQTGESLFDGSLDTAFRTGIEQSRFVRVLPSNRVRGALKRMRLEPNGPLEAATAREVAEREGAKVVVVPSITGVGGSYVLTATLQEPASGASLHAEMVQASAPSQILGSLDELIRGTRQAIGESVAAIEQTSKPLAEATTASLEALKEHSRGTEMYRQWRLNDAKLHYENALELDPNFTAARAQLGALLVEQFGAAERERGKALIQQATLELDGLTEKERLGILAFHARAVENDTEKAIEYYRVRAGSYPEDVASHHTLGFYYYQQERFEEAAASLKRAIEVDPYFTMSSNLLGFIYLYEWGDLAAARELALSQVEFADTNAQAYDNLGWAYLGYDDLQRAEGNFRRAVELNPEFSNYRFRLAHVFRITGRYAEALEQLDYVRERPVPLSAGGEADTRASAEYDAGVIERLVGDESRARKHFQLFLEHAERELAAEESAEHYIAVALAHARLGDLDASRVAEERARALDDGLDFDYALLLAVQGRSDEALDRLVRACDGGAFTNYVWMKLHPDLDGLWDDPELQALFDRHVTK